MARIYSEMPLASGALIALLALSLTGCNQDQYRVVERTQRLIPDASEGTHVEVGYSLLMAATRFTQLATTAP